MSKKATIMALLMPYVYGQQKITVYSHPIDEYNGEYSFVDEFHFSKGIYHLHKDDGAWHLDKE